MLKRIRLELARTRQFPDGHSGCGYVFIAPLDSEGHLDLESWKVNKENCTVHRFWIDEDDEYGMLRHRAGHKWFFDYDEGDDEDDEPIFRFDQHTFKVGEYVSVTEHDGETRPFRVVSVISL